MNKKLRLYKKAVKRSLSILLVTVLALSTLSGCGVFSILKNANSSVEENLQSSSDDDTLSTSGSDSSDGTVNVASGDELNADDTSNSNDASNKDDALNADDESATASPVEIPVTSDARRTIKSVPDEAKEYAIIQGLDKDLNVIWEYTTEEVYVGQYESISYPWVNGDGVYFTCGGKMYCIDIVSENYGQVKWVSKDEVGYGCSFDFDEDGNVYVMGYDGDGFYVFDPDGNTLRHISELVFDDPEDGQNCFWKSSITYYQGGYVGIYFDSIDDSRIFNAETGYEGLPDIDFSDLDQEWEIYSFEIDGDYRTGDEIGSTIKLDIPYEGDISFYCKEKNTGDVENFAHMEGRIKLGNMFYGMENSTHKWYITCRHDEENLFSLGLQDDGTLRVFWYHGPWTDEVYPAVIDMIFKKAE